MTEQLVTIAKKMSLPSQEKESSDKDRPDRTGCRQIDTGTARHVILVSVTLSFFENQQ